MTTDLLAALFGEVAIEDAAARVLLDLLRDAARQLDENATSLQDLVPDDHTIGDDPEVDRVIVEAYESGQLAEELGDWIGDLSAALVVPPDQRQAIY
jgi:hypothetical protein